MWESITKERGSAKQPAAPARPRTPWHAVSIVSSTPCCATAIALLGARFLSKEAPHLPLPECPFGERCKGRRPL